MIADTNMISIMVELSLRKKYPKKKATIMIITCLIAELNPRGMCCLASDNEAKAMTAKKDAGNRIWT